MIPFNNHFFVYFACLVFYFLPLPYFYFYFFFPLPYYFPFFPLFINLYYFFQALFLIAFSWFFDRFFRAGTCINCLFVLIRKSLIPSNLDI